MQRWGLVLLSIVTLVAVAAAAQQVVRVIHQPATHIVASATTAAVPTHTSIPQASPSITATRIPTRVITQTLVASITPRVTLTPSPLPVAQGYIAYRIKDGETLDTVATAAGSSADYIRAYNHFGGDPAPQRPLIIPQLNPHQSTLTSQAILVQRGANRPAVALTFDAGAGSVPTTSILDTLATRHVHVTFFLTGTWIRKNPDLTRRIIADGHEIANHSTTHPDFTTISDAQITQELRDMAQALFETTGTMPAPFFRPPFGAYNEQVLRSVITNGYLPIFWTLDSLDSVGESKTPAFLVDRITNTLAADKLNGAIFLVHCGSQPTADALPEILDTFAKRGIIVTTLSQVL